MKYSREFEHVCNQSGYLTYLLVFEKLELDIYSLVGILGGSSGYHISDPNVIKVG